MLSEIFIQHRKKILIVATILALSVVFAVFLAVTRSNNETPVDCSSLDSVCYDGNLGITVTLPYDSPLYTITYTKNPKDPNNLKNVIVTISAYSGYRNAAVEKIYDFGFNPADYDINFNYENPFKAYE